MIVTVGSPFCKYTVNTCIWIDILTTYNSPFFPTGRLVVEMCLLPSTKCCQNVVPLEVEFGGFEALKFLVIAPPNVCMEMLDTLASDKLC